MPSPSLTQPPPLARPVAACATGAFLGWAMAGGEGAAVGGIAGLALASMAPPPKGAALTEDRERLYRRAMRSDSVAPDALDRLADAFDQQHLTAHAIMLRRRASALRLTPEQCSERRRHFLRGLASQRPEAVAKLAATYRAEGSLLAEQELLQHAADLRAVAAGKVDEAIVQRFEQRAALVRDAFGEDSAQAASATTNLDAARAALTPKESTP